MYLLCRRYGKAILIKVVIQFLKLAVLTKYVYVWCVESSPEEQNGKNQTVEIASTCTAKTPSNPIVLTEDDIQTICENLKSASKDWFNLGLALKVKFGYLKNIQDQYLENNRRLAEVVGKRLEVTDPKHPVTWPYICECLRNCTVERNDVANEIEKLGLC